uniref:Uncharacterized protein n=1 Tax=Oryza brachyantha TaxID=4533 RepID=J3LAE9_ORYBR
MSGAAPAPAPGERDELADSLAELFANVSLMVRGELQCHIIINKFSSLPTLSSSSQSPAQCHIIVNKFSSSPTSPSPSPLQPS